MTYNDPDSLYLKAARAMQLGITGLNIFDVRDKPNWDLADGTRIGLGLPNAAAQSLPDGGLVSGSCQLHRLRLAVSVSTT